MEIKTSAESKYVYGKERGKQIYIEGESHAKLKQIAARHKVSIYMLVNAIIENWLENGEVKREDN